ncbi:MAG: PD-(D/E)XK nuclease family protein [Candidatus Aminicenantes bacterium]|nr:PD-(D/E)XK nuclease family protein [Candidatus Aminicenantes bacterium]
MATFSHSRLSSYETCPLRYKFAYIDRVKVEAEDTVETFLGSRAHEALEKLYRNLQFERLLSVDEVLAFFNREWEKNWNEAIIIVNKEYTAENYRKMGERYLKDYYKRHKPFDKGKILGLETTNTLPLDKEGKYGFYIRIDRLMDMGEGVYEVHDYKTNMSLPKQEDLDKDRQLAMYSLWVREQFQDFKKVRLVWHFLAFDKEMESFRTKKQLEDLRKDVLDEIQEIEATEKFPANVTRLCFWCLYRGMCPEWKHEVELEDKPENEYLQDPGVKLVDEYVKTKNELENHKRDAEAKLEKLKDALIAFCEKEEVSVVFGSENKISVKPYESVKFPPRNSEERETLVMLLKDIGKLNEVSDLDIHALSGVLKNRKWEKHDIERLSEFGIRETKHRLSISKHEKQVFGPPYDGPSS